MALFYAITDNQHVSINYNIAYTAPTLQLSRDLPPGDLCLYDPYYDSSVA